MISATLARVVTPNPQARILAHTSDKWNRFYDSMPDYDAGKSPYANMPPGGRQIQARASIALPDGPYTGVDIPVLTETAPIGYDGIITHVTNLFTGTGFGEGSGSIVWRVRIGNKYARNLGNIHFTYGSLAEPFSIPGQGLPIVSGQQLIYSVSIPAGSPVGGVSPRIICAVFGWYYPRK